LNFFEEIFHTPISNVCASHTKPTLVTSVILKIG